MTVTAIETPETSAEAGRSLPRRFPTDWAWTMAVAAVAAVLRLVHLTHPTTIVFDEYYYTPEASELLAHGVEWNEKSNVADFVAHPPLGKWCIALGVAIFGDNALGWRVPCVLAGVISVVLIVRVALQLFESLFLAVVAGLLMSLDGMHFVLSRTAILDIFLLAFVLGAFGCLLKARAAHHLWWRLGAGALLGLAMGVKWSAIWYLAGFALLLFVWDLRAKRGFWRSVWSFAVVNFLAIFGYVATWSGWFATNHGWRRHWLANHGVTEIPVLAPVVNLIRYHLDMALMHAGLNADHVYQSQPWQWLLLARPVMFYWTNGVQCGAQRCDSEILLLGTPLLGWSFLPALLVVLWLAVRRRDWRYWTILAGVAAAFVPWLLMPARTKFYFYALPSEPFFILAVVAVLALFLGGAAATAERRTNGIILITGYVIAIALCYAYYYPLYTAMPLTHEQWWARLWWLGDNWI